MKHPPLMRGAAAVIKPAPPDPRTILLLDGEVVHVNKKRPIGFRKEGER